MGVQVLCVFTSASNLNSFYGLKIWGYIDFSRVCLLSKKILPNHVQVEPRYYHSDASKITRLPWPW